MGWLFFTKSCKGFGSDQERRSAVCLGLPHVHSAHQHDRWPGQGEHENQHSPCWRPKSQLDLEQRLDTWAQRFCHENILNSVAKECRKLAAPLAWGCCPSWGKLQADQLHAQQGDPRIGSAKERLDLLSICPRLFFIGKEWNIEEKKLTKVQDQYTENYNTFLREIKEYEWRDVPYS